MKSAHFRSVLLGLALASLGAGVAMARPGPHEHHPSLPPRHEPRGHGDHGRRERPPAPHRSLSRGEAARRAQHMNGGGRVLAVQQIGGGYRVKLIKRGEVRFVYIPNP